MKRRALLLIALIALSWCAISSQANAHSKTLGLLLNETASWDGYTLFAPLRGQYTYLINNDGNVVHTWNTGPGVSAYLLEDGTLLRSQNPASTVRKYAWDGTLIWDYSYLSAEHFHHHDVDVLPNGNILILADERKTGTDAIAAGRDPTLLRDDELQATELIEVQPTGLTTGDIVWEWHSWDHLVQDYDAGAANYNVVGDHPELIDLNYIEPTRPATGESDWHHANGIDYNASLDQIVISVRHMSEIWVVDHSTATTEAASHSGGTAGKGGDLLYRWGNPAAYDTGTTANQQLFSQHNAAWIEDGRPGEGNITIFNNGNGRPGGNYSSVVEIEPPVDNLGNYSLTPGDAYAPAAPVWTYEDPVPSNFYSFFISGAFRLPNGNTLICDGAHGRLFEVTPDGTIVWQYVNPVTDQGPQPQGTVFATGANVVFRAYRYAADYTGLQGHDLTPQGPLEINPDGDGDGLPDDQELKIWGTNPAMTDTDADHLSDFDEVMTAGTDPLLGDTDGGGAPDGLDAAMGGDPLLAGDDAVALAGDFDGDGCSNGRELGPLESLGGRRDPFEPWDFYDTDGGRTVDLFFDILGVASLYGADADDDGPDEPDGYDPTFDRSAPAAGAEQWQVGAPDGVIDLFNDIFGVVRQFGHNCTGS